MNDEKKIEMARGETCPYNKSLLLWILRLCIMIFGTTGLYFFNLWVSVVYFIYSIVFNFWAMPVKHCKYCYYKVTETTIDKKNERPLEKRVPLEKWKETYLPKHIVCAKKWGINFFILWLIPIVLIIISLFSTYSVYGLISLIIFILSLTGNIIFCKTKICPTCAFQKECFDSF